MICPFFLTFSSRVFRVRDSYHHAQKTETRARRGAEEQIVAQLEPRGLVLRCTPLPPLQPQEEKEEFPHAGATHARAGERRRRGGLRGGRQEGAARAHRAGLGIHFSCIERCPQNHVTRFLELAK